MLDVLRQLLQPEATVRAISGYGALSQAKEVMMDKAGAPNFLVTGYTGAPRGRDYERWREELSRTFCGLDIMPSEGDNIDCRLDISLLGGLALAVPGGSSARFSRTREILRDGCDHLVLVTATSGRTHVVQNGREIELSESQMCLTDMSVLGTISHNERGRFTTTRIPRSMLLAASPKAEDRLSLVLGDQAPIREAIARYQALAASVGPHTDVIGRHLMAQHTVDLLGLLLGADADRTELANRRGHSAARLDRMRADVVANLSRNDLTIYSVARKAGVSPRHAQRMFEETGATFTEFLLERRLLLVRELLLDPLNRWRKVSDLAHSAGFPDISYFNRVFRRRFGATPSDMRGPRAR